MPRYARSANVKYAELAIAAMTRCAELPTPGFPQLAIADMPVSAIPAMPRLLGRTESHSGEEDRLRYIIQDVYPAGILPEV